MTEARFNSCFCPPESSVLLLPAGEFCDIFIKPGLYAEERGHLGHPPADSWGIVSQTFQSEGQLVPHLVGNDLVFRRLLDKADALGLGPLVKLVQRTALEENLAASSAMGGQNGLHLAQEGGISAPRRTAEDQKLPLLYRH